MLDFLWNFLVNFLRNFLGNFLDNFLGRIHFWGGPMELRSTSLANFKKFLGNFLGNCLGNFLENFLGNCLGNFLDNFLDNFQDNFLGSFLGSNWALVASILHLYFGLLKLWAFSPIAYHTVRVIWFKSMGRGVWKNVITSPSQFRFSGSLSPKFFPGSNTPEAMWDPPPPILIFLIPTPYFILLTIHTQIIDIQYADLWSDTLII